MILGGRVAAMMCVCVCVCVMLLNIICTERNTHEM